MSSTHKEKRREPKRNVKWKHASDKRKYFETKTKIKQKQTNKQTNKQYESVRILGIVEKN
jgi:hypothetical protein